MCHKVHYKLKIARVLYERNQNAKHLACNAICAGSGDNANAERNTSTVQEEVEEEKSKQQQQMKRMEEESGAGRQAGAHAKR